MRPYVALVLICNPRKFQHYFLRTTLKNTFEGDGGFLLQHVFSVCAYKQHDLLFRNENANEFFAFSAPSSTRCMTPVGKYNLN